MVLGDRKTLYRVGQRLGDRVARNPSVTASELFTPGVEQNRKLFPLTTLLSGWRQQVSLVDNVVHEPAEGVERTQGVVSLCWQQAEGVVKV